jgi:hypothetical protein
MTKKKSFVTLEIPVGPAPGVGNLLLENRNKFLESTTCALLQN